MNASDVILLVQAGIGIITLAVLVWYTYETRRIRLDANAQNKLISGQLAIMQQSLAFEQNREAQNAQPVFVWRAWGCTGTEVYYQFTNHGALITNAKVSADGGLVGWFEPKDIANSQPGYLKFKGLKTPQRVLNPINFSVEFTDGLNERRKINYIAPLNSCGDLARPEVTN